MIQIISTLFESQHNLVRYCKFLVFEVFKLLIFISGAQLKVLLNRKKCFFTDKPPAPSISIKLPTKYPSKSVASFIKKFDQLDKNPINSPNPQKQPKTAPKITSPTPIRKPPNKTATNPTKTNATPSKTIENNIVEEKPQQQIKYKLPSPSLMRKTQAFMAKENSNEFLSARRFDKPPPSPKSARKNLIVNSNEKIESNAFLTTIKSSKKDEKVRQKSESFQKAAAFWNNPKR